MISCRADLFKQITPKTEVYFLFNGTAQDTRYIGPYFPSLNEELPDVNNDQIAFSFARVVSEYIIHRPDYVQQSEDRGILKPLKQVVAEVEEFCKTINGYVSSEIYAETPFEHQVRVKIR